jgi:hypothetical protein
MPLRYPTLAVALVLAATAASGQAFVGKTVSLFAAVDEGSVAVSPDRVTIASVAVPTKYRSQKHFLLVTASVAESCLGRTLASFLTVGGVAATPDPGGDGPTECSDSDWAFRTKQWLLPPESQGGPEVPPGALVELKLTDHSGPVGSGYGTRVLRVEIAK